jgi:hypothetical protein
MALFLETHNLGGRDAQAFVDTRSGTGNGSRCLKHWISGDRRRLTLLVEASDRQALSASHPGAREVTEVFAPAERWMSFETLGE